jgi:hypothetical protein
MHTITRETSVRNHAVQKYTIMREVSVFYYYARWTPRSERSLRGMIVGKAFSRKNGAPGQASETRLPVCPHVLYLRRMFAQSDAYSKKSILTDYT